MDKYKELYLQLHPIENAKSSDGIQYQAKCPFHNDNNESFGFRIDDGRCKGDDDGFDV